MPNDSIIRDFASDAKAWRRNIHAHPELLYDVHRTAQFVAEKLREFGCDDVQAGIGPDRRRRRHQGPQGFGRSRDRAARRHGRAADRRGDHPSLSLDDRGKMHACGHDGHTAMLLGAARYLAKTRDFRRLGRGHLPAGGGGRRGRQGDARRRHDGALRRAKSLWHAQHAEPAGRRLRHPQGSGDGGGRPFQIVVEGRGGHAAFPHACIDPVLAGAYIVTALQSIVSRNVDPLDSCVVSATYFQAGTAFNIIPQQAEILGTTRTLTAATRDLTERRLREIVQGVALAQGVKASVEYDRGYPTTRNHPEPTDFAADAARRIAAKAQVNTDMSPLMVAEDFSYMLEARPGAFIFIGNGDSAGLHHPAYDFNDDAIPYGMSYWAELVESARL